MDVRLYGLRKCLRKFQEDGRSADCWKWRIVVGGYDRMFDIYYSGFLMMSCIGHELVPGCALGRKHFRRIARIVTEEYPDCHVAETKKG